MEVIRHAGAIRANAVAVRASERSLGLVPTMGFFHEGHLSLIRRARAERNVVVVSIFVNPLQFGRAEDLDSYPRDLDRDLALAEKEGVDLVFAPDVDEMFPHGRPEVTVDPGSIADRLEGAARPGHFRGVCTVLARLFHLVGPSRGYFGEKDAQQLVVVRMMVRDLAFPVEIQGCPIVREPDGLAMSSRNAYLSSEERTAARCLSDALRRATEAVEEGETVAAKLAALMRDRIEAEPLAALEYAVIVDEQSFEEVARLERPARALVAARVGKPRLIDNTLLPVGENVRGEAP
jgi:pantoate--beta-alanine ligase